MRAALAIATILVVMLTAVAPHAHGGPLGDHGCLACVTAGAEVAASATPDLAPRTLHAEPVERPYRAPLAVGAPLGAVPGQSPPTT